MIQTERIPMAAFDAELALVRYLISEPPWLRQDDRGLRAEYRRWTPADAEPTVGMLAPLWRRTPETWNNLDAPGMARAVRRAALVLHLVSLGLAPDESGKPTGNLGAACRAAGVAEGRFARLMNTPEPGRLEALGRVFRRLRAARVHLQLVADRREEGQPDLRSTRRTLKDLRYDDLAALLVFLFTDDPKPAVSRWAEGYYHGSTTGQETAVESIPETI